MNVNVTTEQVMAAIVQDDNLGFCMECGAEAGGVEPDAEKYQCDVCGEMAVYGAPQLLFYMEG